MSAYVISLLVPGLLAFLAAHALASRLAPRAPRRWVLSGSCAAAVAVVAIPVGGIPLGRWLAGVNASFSVPLVALLVRWAAARAAGVWPADAKAVTATWAFAAIAGVALYPMALGLGRWDPYALGWSYSALHALVLVTTVVLIVRGNRLGTVLALAALAYALRLLESPNFWDYLVDPFLFLASLVALGARAVRRLARERGERGTPAVHHTRA